MTAGGRSLMRPFGGRVRRGSVPSGTGPFIEALALDINVARMSHLQDLGLVKAGDTVLDVGCGPGLLAEELQSWGASVTGCDARSELVDLAIRESRCEEGFVAQVMEDSLLQAGQFDVVFAYGLLYHCREPFRALVNLAAPARGVLLLETQLVDSILPIILQVDEPRDTNQAVDGLGVRPSESWVTAALGHVGFNFVYRPNDVPQHPDFHFERRNDHAWRRDGHNLRGVFVASRIPLEQPALELAWARDEPRSQSVSLIVTDAVPARPLRETGEQAEEGACTIWITTGDQEARSPAMNEAIWPVPNGQLDPSLVSARCLSGGLEILSEVHADGGPAGVALVRTLCGDGLTIGAATVTTRSETADTSDSLSRLVGEAKSLEAFGLLPLDLDLVGNGNYALTVSRPSSERLRVEVEGIGVRGQESAGDGRLVHDHGTWVVQTSEVPWSYAGLLYLDDVATGLSALVIDLDVEGGPVGVGVLADVDTLISEVVVEAGVAQHVEVPIPALPRPWAVVVRTHREALGSRVTIRSIAGARVITGARGSA